MTDNVHNPAHYAGNGDIECIEAMRSMMTNAELPPYVSYCWANAFKYIWRWPLKNGAEDLEKAKVYIDFILDYMGGVGEDTKAQKNHAVSREHIRVKKLSADVDVPAYTRPGDAALDLRATESTVIEPGYTVLIGTGISIELPDGRAALVMPRSGLAVKHGIDVANSPGLIDSNYRGEVKVGLVNRSDEPFAVNKGDRIAQLCIVPVTVADLDEVDELTDTERGADGFGSSGVL